MFSFPLLGRPRVAAVPAFVASMAVLLVCAVPAVAGTWSLALSNYSYTHTLNGSNFGAVPRQSMSPGTNSFTFTKATVGGTSFGGGSAVAVAKVSGTITATWVPDPTLSSDPAPANTIVVISSAASAYEIVNGAATYDGMEDDGYGDSPVNGASSGTHYLLETSSPFTVSPSLSASDTSANFADATAGDATITTCVPAITLAGTTPDSSGNLNILVGQHCSASLVSIPSGCTVSNYTWTVSGTTFQTWSSDTPAVGGNSYNPDASYEVDGPGPLTNPTAGWYWNDHAQTPETVSCTATVTPPAGQGSAFTVTVTQKVTVMLPLWTCKGVGGNMQINTAVPAGNGTDFWLHAGPTAGSGETGGMDWHATVAPPLGTSFGAGSLIMVQKVIPDVSYTVYTIRPFTSTHSWSINGQEGLDTSYPYPWTTGVPATLGAIFPDSI